MTWFKTFGLEELIFVGAFILFYLFYAIRVIRINKALGNSMLSIFKKVGLRAVYFSLLIIALLGPSFGTTSKEIKSVGKDIMIAVDLSESMNAFDVQPTRLEKIKYELKKIVEQFSSDRIGLVIFSSEAFVQCPLTFDQSALNLFIETLNSGLVPNTGTDFAPALGLSLEKLDTEGESIKNQKAKIIILISDGEDFGEESENIGKEIKERGIKLFTLGVGTERGSRIQTGKGFKNDRDGQPVITKLNHKALKSMAVNTGGKYFEINETQNDVNRLINTINKVEGELRDSRQVDISSNKYVYFLALALIMIALDLIGPIKTVRI